MEAGLAVGEKRKEAPVEVVQGHKAQIVDLTPEHIDFTGSTVLNASHPEALKAVLGEVGGEQVVMHSDCDEQLLFNITFKNLVNLSSISITAPPGAAPRTVKLWKNRNNFDFDDADGSAPTQTLELTAADAGGGPLQLQLVKFQRTSSLVVFVQDNVNDEEVSSVQRLSIRGTALETTNMANLEKKG